MISRRFDPAYAWGCIAIDLICVELAWIFSFAARFYLGLPIDKGIPDPDAYIKLVPFIFVIWGFAFWVSGYYDRLLHLRSAMREAVDIFKVCFFATLVFIVVGYFYQEYRYSRGLFVIFALSHPLLMVLAHSFFRKMRRVYTKKRPSRSIMLWCDQENQDAVMDVVSFYGLSSQSEFVLVSDFASNPFSFPVKIEMFPLEGWLPLIEKYGFQVAIIARSFDKTLSEDLKVIADQIGDVRILSDFYGFAKLGLTTEVIGNRAVINIHQSPLEGHQIFLKRCLDFFGALAAVLLFSPVMVLSAFLVRLSSKGPIFYKQERMGLDGKNFSIYKFRTMPTDAELKTGAVWAKSGDSRATSFGKFLRKTSLDELPQLFNVLKGEMSLVGPRPERPVFVTDFRKKIPGYMLRHKVKAGMTGWAQIHGWRGNTSIEKRIEYDLFYIQNWSLWLDIKILFWTIFKGFKHPNAY